MRSPRVASVNVAHHRVVSERPRLLSAIDKIPREEPVAVKDLGLEGDQVGDVRHHGGTFQAVYAYASEDLAYWERELGKRLRPGMFGDNLTTVDIDLNQCVIGEEWAVGSARLTVSSVRTPGPTFEVWMTSQRLVKSEWTERFAAAGRPGVYLTVLNRGYVAPGDFIDVLRVPKHGVTAGTVFRALHHDPDLLPLLLEVDGMPPAVYDRAQAYVDGRG